MNGWFPRYSPDGSQLTWERPNYYQAQWLDRGVEIAHNGTVLVIGGQPTEFPAGNDVSAGGGHWAVGIPGRGEIKSNFFLGILSNVAIPAINPDGEFFYVTDPQTMNKTLVWHGRGDIDRGAITDIRASRQAVVYTKNGETWGFLIGQGPKRIQVAPAEFRPIPIDTPTGPWVLNHTHSGIILRPFGEEKGHRYDNGGQTYYPDGTCIDGIIYVIYTNDHGEWPAAPLAYPLGAPRVLLREVPVPHTDAPHTDVPHNDEVPMANEAKIVEEVRRKYPTDNPGGHPLGGQAWMAIVDVAQHLGGQVYRKDGGDHTSIPAGLLSKYPNGVNISRTIIGRGVFGNKWYKVFSDGEGEAGPIWNLGDTPADGEYVDVSEIHLGGVPHDDAPHTDAPHTDTPPPTSNLEARVLKLESELARLKVVLRSV